MAIENTPISLLLCVILGDAPPIEADERFVEAHDSLVHLLTNQKAVYDEEDHALRVLMEEEVAEKMATSVRTRIQGSFNNQDSVTLSSRFFLITSISNHRSLPKVLT